MRALFLHALVILAGSLACCAPGTATNSAPTEAMQVIAAHSNALSQAEAIYASELNAIGAAYTNALAAISDDLMGEGDPLPVARVLREIERFRREGLTPRTDIDVSHPQVRRARSAYLTALAALEYREQRRREELLHGHEAALSLLVKKLTRDGRIDEALAVQEEIEHTRSETGEIRAHLSEMPVPGAPLSAALRRGLWLHYTFDEDTEREEPDGSPTGPDALKHCARWTPMGRINGGCELRDSAYLLLNAGHESTISGKLSFAVCAWVKTSTAARQDIVQQRDGTSRNGEFELFLDASGTVGYYEFSDACFGAKCSSRAAVNDGKWHHVALVRDTDAGAVSIFVDGVVDRTAPLSPVGISASRRFAIGCDLANMDSHFIGSIDEVMVFSRSLSCEDIMALYSMGAGKGGTCASGMSAKTPDNVRR